MRSVDRFIFSVVSAKQHTNFAPTTYQNLAIQLMLTTWRNKRIRAYTFFAMPIEAHTINTVNYANMAIQSEHNFIGIGQLYTIGYSIHLLSFNQIIFLSIAL